MDISYQKHSGSCFYLVKKFIGKVHIYHRYLIHINKICGQFIYKCFIITITKKPQCHVHRSCLSTSGTLCHSPCGTSSRCHQFYFIPAFFLIDIQNDLQNRCFAGSRSSSNNADRVCKNHTHCFFLPFG